jgi:hypothetical protein
VEKVAQTFGLRRSVIFSKQPKVKQSPNRRKFAQSGHPAHSTPPYFYLGVTLIIFPIRENPQRTIFVIGSLNSERTETLSERSLKL